MTKTKDSATEMTVEKIPIVDIYENYLNKAQNLVDRVDKITMILQDNYLADSCKALEQDRVKALVFQNNYEEIQTMVDVIRDYIIEAKDIMDTVMGLGYKDIATWEKPTDKKANCA